MSTEAHCPVCSSKFLSGDPAKNCPKCGVPHHEHCWEYSGGCAIYGCGGTSTVQVAEHEPQPPSQPAILTDTSPFNPMTIFFFFGCVIVGLVFLPFLIKLITEAIPRPPEGVVILALLFGLAAIME